MAKGLCCAAQKAGDLGKPIIVTITRTTGPLAGTTIQKCGVCEVVPSCRNPQKLVFAFRFLKGIDCGIPGAAKCTPTAAGRAQYESERQAAAARGQTPLTYERGAFIPGIGIGSPYALPPA